MNNRRLTTIFEVTGSALAILYALLIAGWAYLDRRWAFFTLQFFYATSAIIGLVRWG